MPTATGKAWYRLRNIASKLARMEHHYAFLKTCCEENLMPHGLNVKTNVCPNLHPYMLYKYNADKYSFTSRRIQDLTSDTFILMDDLCTEFFSLKSDIQRRFPVTIHNQLLEPTHKFLNRERRKLKSIKQSKLNTLRKNNPQDFHFRGNFEENNFNNFYYPYADFNQNFVTYLDEIDFNDFSYNDFSLENSENFVDFSVNVSQLMPLNRQPDLSNQGNSRTKCNRRFDKPTF